MKRLSPIPIAAAMLLAAAPLWTSAQDKKGVTEPELKYQAGRRLWPASRCTRAPTRRRRR